MANICLSEMLLARWDSWPALVRVLEAWKARFGTPRPVLACDHGLYFGDDQRAFERLARRGASMTPWPLVLTDLDHADQHILAIAQQTGASVLSLDRYLDHRRDHPWVSGTSDRFFGWRIADDASVQIVARRMLVTGEYTMSDAEQAREDKVRGLRDDALDAALAWHFRCTTEGCVLHERFPERLRDLPVGHRGALVCPQCRRPVQRAGERLPSRFIKLSSPVKTIRVGVEAGDSLVVGRGPLGLANRVLAGAELRKVSMNHLEITFDGGQVMVADLGSTNGSTIACWVPRDRVRAEAVDLQPGGRIVLRPNDRLRLARVLDLALSGHRAPRARAAGRDVRAPLGEATDLGGPRPNSVRS